MSLLGILETVPMKSLLEILILLENKASRPGQVLWVLSVSPIPLHLSCYLGGCSWDPDAQIARDALAGDKGLSWPAATRDFPALFPSNAKHAL